MSADTTSRLSAAIAERADGPMYRRIADAIAEAVDTGRLSPGQQLPTHRALAQRLGVAVPTISRAYRTAEERGLLSSTVGRGTFVAGVPFLRDPASRTSQTLDLAVNAPARGEHESLLRQSLSAVAAEPQLARVLGYEADVGQPEDREAARDWIARRGVQLDAGQVVLCHGGQHAILVALGAALRSGEVLACEALTYPGVKSAAQLLGIEIRGVEMDAEGLLPDALEAVCVASEGAVRAVYCMPNAHNPTTSTLSLERREAIVEIARRHNLLLIEDDVFGLLVGEQEQPTALAALAPERTFYLTSLSKTITPGLRWGALVAPAVEVDRLGALVRATIFNPAPVSALLARRWLQDGTAERLLLWQRNEMRTRFTAVEALLGPCTAVRSVRTAGLHAWLEMHEPWTAAEVIDLARSLHIDIGPTSFFHTRVPTAPRGLRLCLGNAPQRSALMSALSQLVKRLDDGPTWASGMRV